MAENPDPKDYRSYEDYLEALKLHEDFLDLSDKTTKAIGEAKSDGDLKHKMEALGFACHDDEYCGRKYCRQNEICLWVAIESFQHDCNERFFGGLLAEKDMIFTAEDTENYCESGCRFPAGWDDESGIGYQSIMFTLDIEEAIYKSRPPAVPFEAFVRQKALKGFFRDLYMFLLIVLRQPGSDKRARIYQKIKNFLEETPILGKSASRRFLKRFDAIAEML